jgi:hypothetical protein
MSQELAIKKCTHLKIGDRVKIVKIPEDLVDSAKIGTPQVFARALGKTFVVCGFGDYGHVELNVTKRDTIWIEPEFVILTKARSKRGNSSRGKSI